MFESWVNIYTHFVLPGMIGLWIWFDRIRVSWTTSTSIFFCFNYARWMSIVIATLFLKTTNENCSLADQTTITMTEKTSFPWDEEAFLFYLYVFTTYKLLVNRSRSTHIFSHSSKSFSCKNKASKQYNNLWLWKTFLINLMAGTSR
jgi:hypothetical protein